MKKIISILTLAVLCCHGLNATTYYFSSTDGDDSRSSAQAQNSSTPWKTINKLNSFFGSLGPGDVILFKKGDVFYGSINITASGKSNSPISFGAYGSGNNPVITGFTPVSSWSSIGGSIWESDGIDQGPSKMNIVSVGNALAPLGRWPNNGYRTISSHIGNLSITDNSMPGSPNWTGGEVVIKMDRWIIDRSPIILQAGGIITYTSTSSYTPKDGWGYFIQNSPQTLDQQNEWYYNPSNHKLRIYSGSSPGTVQASTVDNIVTITNKSNISFSNLSFTGANNAAFLIGSASNISIQNCKIDLCYNGVWGTNFGGTSDNFTIKNCTINHSANNGVNLTNEFTNAYIGYNTIQNTAMIAGMGKSGDGTYMAVASMGDKSTIEYNEVDNTGYVPISFNGNSVTVQNNFINEFASLKDDGGGIYTDYEAKGRTIANNIILNGVGSSDGTNNTSVLRAHGIYIDGNISGNVQLLNNSIANISWSGIFLHNCHDIVARGNTCFNNQIGLLVKNDVSGSPIRKLTLKKNIFVAKTSSQLTADFITLLNDIKNFGDLDSNYYARPIDDNNSIVGSSDGDSGPEDHYNLTSWLSFSGESNSQKSPKAISNANDLRFEYNASSSKKTINLGATYIDIKGTNHPGSIDLSPYSSSVLIYVSGTAANISPVANAGSDQTFFFPASSAKLSGRGTDADGSISSYQWTKIAGPSQFSITSPTDSQTVVNNLSQGTYQFELKVTDNKGASGKDTVQITISPAQSTSDQPPLANAGSDITTSNVPDSVQLKGSGTDKDGTISSYQWTRIAGPGQPMIESPTKAQTAVRNLAQGVYQFELKVTDNKGGTDRDTMMVIIATKVTNQLPTANAGQDLNLPSVPDSITLSGSGTDKDGKITSYRWNQVSGPACTITDPKSAKTILTDLEKGSYIFELVVKDNLSGSARDSIQVNVDTLLPALKRVKVNVNGATNPLLTGGWNNWDVTSSLVSAVFNYEDGTLSPFSASLSFGSDVADNSSSYSGSMAPAQVLRYSSYTSENRELTIGGMNPNHSYDIEFYSSQNQHTNSTTIFQTGKYTDTIETYKNGSDKAMFTGLVPDQNGQITVYISAGDNGYNYLNGFIITDKDSVVNLIGSGDELSHPRVSIAQPGIAGNNVFKLYPNPVVDNFIVDLDNNHMGLMNVQILSVTGALVRSVTQSKDQHSTHLSMSTGNMPPGVYFLRVQIGSWNDTQKFVKQ